MSRSGTRQPPVVQFPKPLTSTIVTEVGRPKTSRSKEEEEVLEIGIELAARDSLVKFDVLVNDEEDDTALGNPLKAQFAGSFVNVPHHHTHTYMLGDRESTAKKMMTTKLTLGLTDLLETLGVEGDESVVVTLVPGQGGDSVAITHVRIVLASVF